MSTTASRIIVTGGAGFIGRNLVSALNDRGESDILIVDRLGEDEKWKNLVGLDYADYLDLEDFRDALSGTSLGRVRGVLHMGACSATTETDADYLMDNNTRYTRELSDWCLTHGARFIYASSAATYGDGSLGYCDADEVTPTLKPLNMYGYSKHLFDQWGLRSGALRKVVGLKYFNVYGPYEDHKGDMRSVVNKAFAQIRESGSVKLFKSDLPDYADGEQKRDFVYVGDAAAQTLWYLDHPEVNGLFNCGTGQARTWIDLMKATFAAMDVPANIEFIDMPDHLKAKYQYFTEADMAKVRASGYTAAPTPIEEGVRRYVQDYLIPAEG